MAQHGIIDTSDIPLYIPRYDNVYNALCPSCVSKMNGVGGKRNMESYKFMPNYCMMHYVFLV